MSFLGSSGFNSIPKGISLTLKTLSRLTKVGDSVSTVWFHHIIALCAGMLGMFSFSFRYFVNVYGMAFGDM